MLSIPRALPPVTHGSAFQAPERLRDTGDVTTLKCAYLGSTPQDRGLFLFIALRWMQRPERVMMWVAENIQACLRIFRRAQHLWIVRDILHQAQGVFYVFVLLPDMGSRSSRGSNPSHPSHPWRRGQSPMDKRSGNMGEAMLPLG